MASDSRVWLRLALFGCLVLLLAAAVESRAVTLNCQTQQCVEVGYVAKAAGDPSNTFCWLDTAIPEALGGGYSGRAYSTTYAAVGYGQDSKGGQPGNQVQGNYRPCKGTSDCVLPGVPSPLPVSGDVISYTGNPQNVPFNTTCPGK